MSVAGSGSVTDASGLISCPGYCSGSYWDGTAVTLTATPSPGYVFKGWSGGDCSGTGTCTVPLLGDVGVTAAFAPARTLTVSVIGAGRGTVTAPGIACPGTCSAKYPEGSTVTLVATPAAGSQFGAWQGGTCPEFASSCTVTLTANAALTVAFDVARSGNAYVVNAGDATVTPVDLTNDTVTHAITGFDAPRQIAIAPDGGTAYVVNTGDNTVSPINLATDATEPRITGFQRPGPIVISPNGKTAYVLEDNRRLVPVNLATNQAQPAITFTTRSGIGDYAASLAISRNGRTVYIGSFTRGAKATRGTVAKFDLATQRVTVMAHGLADPAALAITPNGRTAYVADPVRGAVTPIDVYTHKSINAAKLGRAGALPKANAITITPDGRTVYVAAAHGVGVIDTATNAEKDLDLPGIYSPRGVAMTADGGTVYVINGNGAVVPVDVATNTERAKLTGFSSPSAIAIAAPPIANYSARLARRPKRTRVGLSDVITCLSATTSCTTIQTLTTTEMVSPGSAVAVTAHAQPHRERISLVVGLRKVRIRPLGTVAIVIKLNPLGRLLLGRFGSLPVILSVAIRRGSHTDTVTTRRLILAPQS